MGLFSGISKAFSAVKNFTGLGGSDVLSAGLGGLGFLGGERQNTAQIASSKAQMDFQERMSNTAHQRQVKDLRLAGLNPILSAKLGGASSPGGAMPNIVNPEAQGISSALQSKSTSATTKLMNAQLVSAQETAKATAINNQVNGFFANLTNSKQGRLLLLRDKFGTIPTGLYSAANAAESFALSDPPPAEVIPMTKHQDAFNDQIKPRGKHPRSRYQKQYNAQQLRDKRHGLENFLNQLIKRFQ